MSAAISARPIYLRTALHYPPRVVPPSAPCARRPGTPRNGCATGDSDAACATTRRCPSSPTGFTVFDTSAKRISLLLQGIHPTVERMGDSCHPTNILREFRTVLRSLASARKGTCTKGHITTARVTIGLHSGLGIVGRNSKVPHLWIVFPTAAMWSFGYTAAAALGAGFPGSNRRFSRLA